MAKGSSADGRRNAYDALDFYSDYDNRSSQLFPARTSSQGRASQYRSNAQRGYETDYSRMMDFRPAPARNVSLASARQVDSKRNAFGGLSVSQVMQPQQRGSFQQPASFEPQDRSQRASRIPAAPVSDFEAPRFPRSERARRERAGYDAAFEQQPAAYSQQLYANETSVDFASVTFQDQMRRTAPQAEEAPMEQMEQLETKESLADRFKRKNEESRKARNKKKAEQALERHAAEQSSRSAAADADAPRAAVYEARMGASHKRAARMQDNAAKGLPSLPIKIPEVSLDGVVATFKRPAVFAGAAVACCLALSLGFMYPVTRDYYQAVREQDREAIELELVLDRNQSLKSQVDALQTSDGIKNQARDQLGWIEMGEQIATVEGMDANVSSASIKPRVMSEDIKPPETWYSGILDPLFGVK